MLPTSQTKLPDTFHLDEKQKYKGAILGQISQYKCHSLPTQKHVYQLNLTKLFCLFSYILLIDLLNEKILTLM